MVAGEQDQISKLSAIVVEILFVVEQILVAGIVVWQNMFNIIGRFGIPVHVGCEQGGTSHLHVHIVCQPGQHMEHIATRELVEFKVPNRIQLFVHPLQCGEQLDPNRPCILVPDLAHDPEQEVFIGVPVDLFIIENPGRGKDVNKRRNQLDFLVDHFGSIVHPHRRQDQIVLVCNVSVCIVENRLVPRRQLIRIRLYAQIQTGHQRHLDRYQFLELLWLRQLHCRAGIQPDPVVELFAQQLKILVLGALAGISDRVGILRSQPG